MAQLPQITLSIASNEPPNKQLYGLDAELADKEQYKWEPELERQALDWIENMTGEKITAPFWESLKSGVLLCKTINRIRPGMIDKINLKPLTLIERENIQLYLNACAKLGVESTDLFLVSDLYEKKYLAAVLNNILKLARIAEYKSTAAVPSLISPPTHRRARSGQSNNPVKPWEFEAQAHVRAQQRVNEAVVRNAPDEPATPTSPNADISNKTNSNNSKTNSNSKVNRTKRTGVPKIPGLTRETPIEQLMVAIAQRLNLTKDEIKPDIKLLKESRIRTAGHLYVLNQRKEYWDKLDLPLLIKKELEDVLPDILLSSNTEEIYNTQTLALSENQPLLKVEDKPEQSSCCSCSLM